MSTTFSGEEHIEIIHGEKIIFKNFSGVPTAYTREGDRSFCLIITNPILKNIIIGKGYNIKKLNSLRSVNYEVSGVDPVEFIRIKLPKYNFGIRGGGDEKTLFSMLDHGTIVRASINIEFFNMDIDISTGVRHVTTIYLNRGTFYLKDGSVIEMGKGIKNTYTEETTMEKIMSVEEIITQFALMEYAYKNANSTDKKNLEDIMQAIKSAKHYLVSSEIAKNPDTNKPTVTGYELEKAGDFAAIKQVMFNDNVTIVVWFDDVKTVVKCQKGDTFDKEKGLAMAICKRLYGNKSNFNNIIKKYVNDDKNVQTKKKAKSGTFEERKAARMTQAEANKTANGMSKNFRGKDIVPRKRRGAPAIVNTNKMVVLTDAYADCVRKKMAKRGFSYEDTAKATGLAKSTINRYFSPNVVCQKPKRITMANFKKINKTLGIRWRIEV